MLRITNEAGRQFSIVCVRKGDHYGLDQSLIHVHDDPLIEFYDATHEETCRFKPDSRFIASYPARTLLEGGAEVGLALRGSKDDFRINGKAFACIREWIRTECQAPVVLRFGKTLD